MKNKPKTERKTIDLGELENQIEAGLKLSKAGMISGLALGTIILAAGIFLPREINRTLEKVIEFSAAGLSYVAAVYSHVLYRTAQFQKTSLHMRPEYIDALHKSLMAD